MKTFITSDLHLGEDRFALMGRPFTSIKNMINTLAQNYNSMVGPDDLVYIVGDVCYQKRPEYLEDIQKFNGKKILIRGNHDRPISDEDFLKYFEQVIPEGEGIDLEIEGIPCHLTHYPTLGRKDRFNLVAHIHAAWKYQLNMLNIGVDVHHFYPVDATTIPFHYKAICEYYDNDVWIAYNEINSQYLNKRGKKGSYFS